MPGSTNPDHHHSPERVSIVQVVVSVAVYVAFAFSLLGAEVCDKVKTRLKKCAARA